MSTFIDTGVIFDPIGIQCNKKIPVVPGLNYASRIKRKANAFSLNAIVDVRRRRRRHAMIFVNISENAKASNFNV